MIFQQKLVKSADDNIKDNKQPKAGHRNSYLPEPPATLVSNVLCYILQRRCSLFHGLVTCRNN